MRSNDVIFGYRNDYAWAKHVLSRVVEEVNNRVRARYNPTFYDYKVGDIYWYAANLHVYEQHFYLIANG